MALTVPSGKAHQSRSRTHRPRSRRAATPSRGAGSTTRRGCRGEELAREPEREREGAGLVDLVPTDRVPDRREDEAADLAADEDGDEVPDLEDLRRASTGAARPLPLGAARSRAAAVSSPGRVPAGTESDPGAVVGLQSTHLGSRTGDRAVLPWSIHPQWSTYEPSRRAVAPAGAAEPAAAPGRSRRQRRAQAFVAAALDAVDHRRGPRHPRARVAGRARWRRQPSRGRLLPLPRPRRRRTTSPSINYESSSGKITGRVQRVTSRSTARRSSRRRANPTGCPTPTSRCSPSTTSAATTSPRLELARARFLIYLLPFVLLVGFFVWMSRRAQGQMGAVMNIGRSRAKVYNTDKPKTTFADVAGYGAGEGRDHRSRRLPEAARASSRTSARASRRACCSSGRPVPARR